MARPNLSYLKNLALFTFGIPIGVITGLTAMGGSGLLIPGVRWLLGFRPARAAATALAVTCLAALAALLSSLQRHHLDLGLALLLIIGQLVGAGWGVGALQRLPVLNRLSYLWGSLLAAAGLLLIAQGRGIILQHPEITPLPHFLFWLGALGIAIGTGFVGRLMELRDVLLVPALVEGLHLSPPLAQGTALVVLLLAALLYLSLHVRQGNVEPQSSTWISVGAAFGALTGAYWASEILQESVFLVLYGIFLTLFGLMMFWRQELSST